MTAQDAQAAASIAAPAAAHTIELLRRESEARKDAEAAAKQPAGAAPRQARAYRELFQLLKAQMTTAVEPDAAPGEPEADQE